MTPWGKSPQARAKKTLAANRRELNSGLDLETKILSPPVEAETFFLTSLFIEQARAKKTLAANRRELNSGLDLETKILCLRSRQKLFS